MTTKGKKLLGLLAGTAVAAAVTSLLPRQAQDLRYHDFADQRTFLGIPNALNVLSNIPFAIVGLYGLWCVSRCRASHSLKLIYTVVFTGVLLTFFGSAWYHLRPDNERLVFDRLPMVVIFMAFMAAVVSGWVDEQTGRLLLVPLLVLGLGSVAWWYHKEQGGQGDLRFYGFIQFYPMVVTPVLLLLQPRTGGGKRDSRLLLLWVVFWYLLAKAAEHWDHQLFQSLHVIGGHAIKHLLAAIACYYIVLYFRATHGPCLLPGK